MSYGSVDLSLRSSMIRVTSSSKINKRLAPYIRITARLSSGIVRHYLPTPLTKKYAWIHATVVKVSSTCQSKFKAIVPIVIMKNASKKRTWWS